MNTKSLVCVFIRGLPGSGKTSLAKNVSAKFEATVLDPDNLPPSINLREFKTTRLKILKYRHLLDRCVENLKLHKNVIWEQPWRKVNNLKITSNIIDDSVKGLGLVVKFLVVEIYVDKDISWSRSKAKFTNKKNFEEYISKYQKYNLDLPYLQLDGSKSMAMLTECVIEKVKALEKDKISISEV